MSDYAFGVYLIQAWASMSGANPQDAVTQFKAVNGTSAISELGGVFSNQHLNIDSAKSQFQSLIDGGAAQVPTLSDLNTAILAVAGQPPSTWSIVKSAVAETGKQIETGASIAFTGLKYVAIIALVLGAGYVAWQAGLLKGVRRAA